MKNKKGNISYIFTLGISIIMLFITIITIINMLTPFIWYQKLENIASKYVYVVEKFGYLTNIEKEALINELKKDGFDEKQIVLECPEHKLAYGESFKFELTYKLRMNSIIFNEEVKRETKEVLLHVRKYGYSKI